MRKGKEHGVRKEKERRMPGPAAQSQNQSWKKKERKKYGIKKDKRLRGKM